VQLPADDAVARSMAEAIRTGDVEAVRQLLTQQPEVASARIIGRRGGARTVLHIAADWPGQFPNAPEIVRMLVAAGADVNADTGGSAPETPLHWAASSDDVDVAGVLIDLGANLETPGGSIGTPLDNAIGYGCWAVAHLLVRRGARVDRLWHAAALGLLGRVEELLSEVPVPGAAEINQAFWHACSGAQQRTAAHLLARGADINFVPSYNNATPLGAATAVPTRRGTLAAWLREHGAQ